MGKGSAGKGTDRRPTLISREEEDLRYKLYQGAITFNQFEHRMKKLQKEGKITRRGRRN